jgi:hypothetical protein
MFQIIKKDSRTEQTNILFIGSQEECLNNKQSYEKYGAFASEETLEIKEVL